MVYRTSMPAPVSRVPETRRGHVVGTFCLECGSVYPLHHARHAGKPVYGRDHVAAPCAHEGERFGPGEGWWESAVEVLPAPVEEPEPAPASA
jgi:hypothetical protein